MGRHVACEGDAGVADLLANNFRRDAGCQRDRCPGAAQTVTPDIGQLGRVQQRLETALDEITFTDWSEIETYDEHLYPGCDTGKPEGHPKDDPEVAEKLRWYSSESVAPRNLLKRLVRPG